MADDNLKNKENEKGMATGAGATTDGQYQQGQAGRNPQDKGQDAGAVGDSQRKPEESRGDQSGNQQGSRGGSQVGGQQGGQNQGSGNG